MKNLGSMIKTHTYKQVGNTDSHERERVYRFGVNARVAPLHRGKEYDTGVKDQGHILKSI